MFSKAKMEKIGSWMYRNARPLDLARWQYHFEKGDRQAPIAIQNLNILGKFDRLE